MPPLPAWWSNPAERIEHAALLLGEVQELAAERLPLGGTSALDLHAHVAESLASALVGMPTGGGGD